MKVKSVKKVCWILLLFSTSLQAKDLGTFGETFPIIEDNLLTVIQSKLQKLNVSGELKNHQQKIQNQTVLKLQRPTIVPGLMSTKTPRSFMYNPSITLSHDLKDHDGKVFFKAGTTVDPLETASLRYALLFIDGDDKVHLDWAMNQKRKTKIILVKGAPFELMKQYSIPFFFDQGGALVKKFGITQIPVRITQEGKYLKIEEVLPTEGAVS